MITKIGIVAGDIWHYLDQKGETTLSTLFDNIEKERDVILMSVGWLAREGHIVLEKFDSDYKIKLRKSDK